jgi:Domain of unknown function (DUF4145)
VGLPGWPRRIFHTHKETEAPTVPGNDCLWLNDGERRTPIAPNAGQPGPQQTVQWDQFEALSCGALKHADLVPESQILQPKGTVRTQDRRQRGKECRQENEHQERDLYNEIEDLAAKGVLPPLMKEWSHEVRELGNDAAHPKPQTTPPTPENARDIVEFLDRLLMYLYDFPKKISGYRARPKPKTP